MRTGKKIINATGIRYMSDVPEFKEGLPFGVLNKKTTDAGGSFAALKCNKDYIIVVPNIDLVKSIKGDTNNENTVLGIWGETTKKEITEYLDSVTLHKIAVTYDSLKRLVSILEGESIPPIRYKVLIDEYHLIIEELDYRETAINSLLHNLKKFSHYTFMSATPIDVEIEIAGITDLPYTELVYDNLEVVRPFKIVTQNVYKAVVKTINDFKSEEGLILEDKNGDMTRVEELYIYMNSVRGIKQILDSAKLESGEVKVMCADRQRNREVLTSKYDIYTVSSAWEGSDKPKINFITKKGFQGCNLFSNNGLTIVVSDSKREHTLVDVSTTLFQIIGRLRSNKEYNNVFKKIAWHIYSVKNAVQSESDFNDIMVSLKEDAVDIIDIYKGSNARKKEILKKRLDVDGDLCYYNEEDDSYVYSPLKEAYMKYNYKLVNKVYESGVALRDYAESFKRDSKRASIDINSIQLEKMVSSNFSKMLKTYVLLREEFKGTLELDGAVEGLVKKYELEIPLFKEAYDRLGVGRLGTLDYNKKRIIADLYDESNVLKKGFYAMIFKSVGNGNFISTVDLKMLMVDVAEKIGMKTTKGFTTNLLKDCKWIELEAKVVRIDNKIVRGVVIRSV